MHDTLRLGRTRQDDLLTSFVANAASLLTPDPADCPRWTVERNRPNSKNRTHRSVTDLTA